MSDPLALAVQRVQQGGLVAFPTETVWGLGADATSEPSLEALRHFKGRASSTPISILVGADAELEALGFEPSPAARALTRHFWPGPLTLVMPCKQRFATGVARADGAVGVRCSPHPDAVALAKRLAAEGVGPMTATSLNASGAPAARTREEARVVCARANAAHAPLLLPATREAGGGDPTTVIDVCGHKPEVLRWGAIDEARLNSLLEELAA